MGGRSGRMDCLILLRFFKTATAVGRMWKVTMMLHRGVFRYHCIRLYHAKERWFACFIFMRSWTTAPIAAGNVTNSNHCADTRCGVVFLRGRLSGVALLQTDDVSSGRSGLLVKYRRAPSLDQGETAISTTASAYVSSVEAVNAMTVLWP